MPLLIILIVLALFVIAGAAFRLFVLEKVDPVLEGGDLEEEFLPEGDELPEDRDEFASQEEEYPQEIPDYFDELVERGDPEGGEGESETPETDETNQLAEVPVEYTYDPLTDLKTGKGFLADCQQILDVARQEGREYAVAWFDIDRFRFINSLKGYSIGDYVLATMAREIRNAFPMGAVYTRLSADHFAVLFPWEGDDYFPVYVEQIKNICDKIRGDMAIKGALKTCSGFSVTGPVGRDYDIRVLLHKANIARHCLKISKTENYGVFDDSMLSSYLYGESALEDYNENQYGDEFELYFRPQSNIVQNRITGAEVQAVWVCDDNRRGELAGGRGFEGLPTNGTKIFYHACRAVSRWRKAGRQPVTATISLSITELFKKDIDSFFNKCLTEFQLEPGVINIMLDASIFWVERISSLRQVKKIRELGVGVGLEGMSVPMEDPSILEGLPIQFVKLDRQVMTLLNMDEQYAAQVALVYNDLSARGVQVIFDGVDKMEQMEAVFQLGGRLVSGSFAGSPCVSDDFGRVLQEAAMQQVSPIGGTVILDERDFQKGNFQVR